MVVVLIVVVVVVSVVVLVNEVVFLGVVVAVDVGVVVGVVVVTSSGSTPSGAIGTKERPEIILLISRSSNMVTDFIIILFLSIFGFI